MCTAASSIDRYQPCVERKPIQSNITVRDGKIDTGRYEVEVKDDQVWIRDRHTNTWVKLWGDPHGETSDGDKFQFHENCTFDLPDGTKISIKTTPKGADGIAFIDSVAVMNGKQGIEVNGVHDGQSGVQMGQLTNDVAALDAKYADGTVLTVGPQGQIDDLFTSKGEIVGKDKTQRWDEHNVDGLGGKSKYDFTNKDDWSNLAKGSFESQLAKARSPEEIMFLVAQMLQKLAGKKAEEISKEAQRINKSGGSSTDQLAKMNFDLQQLQQAAQQFFTSATNLSKSRHDTQMAIVGNYK